MCSTTMDRHLPPMRLLRLQWNCARVASLVNADSSVVLPAILGVPPVAGIQRYRHGISDTHQNKKGIAHSPKESRVESGPSRRWEIRVGTSRCSWVCF